MKKKSISIILTVSFLCTLLSIKVIANGVNTISMTKKMNIEFMQSINAKTQNINKFSNNNNHITVNLSSNDDHYYFATGTIEYPNHNFRYAAEGELKSIRLNNEYRGYIGILSGEIKENGEHINLTIHTIPKENKLFVFTTLGTIDKINNFQTFIYGETFEEMNEMVKSYTSENAIATTNSFTNSLKTLSADDYNPKLQGTGYGLGDAFGISYNLAAVTFFSPNKTCPNERFSSYVKINSNNNGAQSFIRRAYAYPGSLFVWTEKGTCEIGTDDEYMQIVDIDPGDDSFNVSLPIPYISQGTCNFLPINLNIGFSKIKTTLKSINGSSVSYDNIATWNHNYKKDMSWSNNNPAETKIGYSGRADISYQHNLDNDYTSNLYGTGSVTYGFQHTFANQTYMGSATIECPKIDADIIVKAREE